MKTAIKCNVCHKENPSKLPDFLLRYCTSWNQRQDTADSPDSANYLEVSIFLSLVALGWLKLVPCGLAASAFPAPLQGNLNYQQTFPPSLTDFQTQSESTSPCLIEPYFMNISQVWMSGYLNSLLWTTTTFRITFLGKARFPQPSPAPSLPRTCLGFAPRCNTIMHNNALSQVLLLSSG